MSGIRGSQFKNAFAHVLSGRRRLGSSLGRGAYVIVLVHSGRSVRMVSANSRMVNSPGLPMFNTGNANPFSAKKCVHSACVFFTNKSIASIRSSTNWKERVCSPHTPRQASRQRVCLHHSNCAPRAYSRGPSRIRVADESLGHRKFHLWRCVAP